MPRHRESKESKREEKREAKMPVGKRKAFEEAERFKKGGVAKRKGC